MSDLKPKRAAYDFRMSLHYGLAAGEADALFGIRVQNKLCWPPKQVEEDDTVERLDLSLSNRIAAYRAMNSGLGAAAAFGSEDPSIMTTARSDMIEQDELFGGDDGAGGVHGIVDWMPGSPDQVPPDHVDIKSGFDVGQGPGHRGYSSVFFSGGRKRQIVRNAIGGVASIIGRLASFAGVGFLWSTNDPRQPSASFRVMRIPRAEPLSDWARSQFSSGAYPVRQMNVLMIPGEYDKPRKNDDDNDMTPGGGFPRANPAALIYEIVSTSGYDHEPDRSLVDVESFIVAARIFSMEGLGISVKNDSDDGYEDLITEICDHVGATVFLHPSTGLYTIRVLRADSLFDGLTSDPGSVTPRPEKRGFVITPSNATINGDIKSRVAAELVSALEATYTIDETEERGVVTLISGRAVAASGGANTTSKGYPLFRDSSAAISAGTRDLSVMSTPAVSFEVDLSREAWDVAPFDVVTVDWPTEPSIHGKRFRVAEIDYGTSGDRTITAGIIEDVFNIADPRYAQVAAIEQKSIYRSARSSSPSVAGVYISPAPAPILIRSGVTTEDLETMSDDGTTISSFMVHSPRVLIGANTMNWLNGQSPPSEGVLVDAIPRALTREYLPLEFTSTINVYELNFGAQSADMEVGDKLIFVRPSSATSVHFIACPPSNVTETTDAVRYSKNISVANMTWAVGSAALALDPDADTSVTRKEGASPYYREEIAQITAIDRDTGIATIRRGVYDTVPAPIPAGSAVFHFVDGREVPTVGPEISGSSYNTSVVAKDASGDAKSRVSVQFHSALDRFNLPSRPGNATISAGGFTAGIGGKISVTEAVPVTVSWSPRNRLLDDADPRAWDAGPVTAEPGSLYYVKLWRRIRSKTGTASTGGGTGGLSPANMVAAWYNLSGNSFVIPAADIVADMADPTSMDPASGTPIQSDITAGASYAIEIGTHRGEVTPSVSAKGSIQNALLLLDVAVSSGGYGLGYGNNWGGV